MTGLFLAVAILFIFIFSLNWLTHHNESKTVPSVVGKSFEDAEKILDNAGFEVEIQDSIYADTAKPRQVLKQVPESDEIIKVNRTVYLTINRAVPPMVEIPNIIGYSYRSAEMEMNNRGIRSDTVYQLDFAYNSVLKILYNGQVIKPGEKISMGSKVTFVIGTGVGVEKFVVPSLIGVRFCDAKSVLESKGLAIGSIRAEGVTDTCNAYIFMQNPTRLDEDGKPRFIRTGQIMDVWLQVEKPPVPVIDSANNKPTPE